MRVFSNQMNDEKKYLAFTISDSICGYRLL